MHAVITQENNLTLRK